MYMASELTFAVMLITPWPAGRILTTQWSSVCCTKSTALVYTPNWCYFVLTVNPPKIIQHPKDQSVATEKNAVFSIKATGDELLFQWKKNDHDLSDNDKYQGTKTHTLRIAAMEESDETRYRCLVKNDVGELLSDPALFRTSKFLVAISCICNVKLYNQIPKIP